MKMAKASATKFLNVKPPSKSNVSSQFFFGRLGREPPFRRRPV
jgi:hypothetical protein